MIVILRGPIDCDPIRIVLRHSNSVGVTIVKLIAYASIEKRANQVFAKWPRINYKCSEKSSNISFLNDVFHQNKMNIIDWNMVNCITDDKHSLLNCTP